MKARTVVTLAMVVLVAACAALEKAADLSGVSSHASVRSARSVADKVETASGTSSTGDVTAGIQTSEELDADPYGFRVRWILWDSGFRDSGLEPGDRIIAVDGVRYDRSRRDSMRGQGIGEHAEERFWNAKGARDGTRVTLTVKRRKHVMDIDGEVRAERQYYTPDRRRTLGPGGPEALKNDGFRRAWDTWHDEHIRFGSRVLDGGWQAHTFDNRRLLREHLPTKARYDHLAVTHPGPFADAMLEDWERVRASLAGEVRTLTEADLEYRGLAERQAAEVAAAGKKARQALLARLGDAVIEPFPSIDPIEGDRGSVVGKVVVLPPVNPRQWVVEGGRCYLAAGDRSRGYYFAACDSPEMTRAFDAWHRYRKRISTDVDAVFSLVGRIRKDPRMLVVRGDAVTGLVVEALGATVDDALFVDLTVDREGVSPFAGEDALVPPSTVDLAPDASPTQVVEAMVEAVKNGDESRWQSLVADWRVVEFSARTQYYPFYSYQARFSREWLAARKNMLGPVFGANVVYEGEVRRLMDGSEFAGAPTVDRVVVEIEHIGQFDGEYRTFTNLSVRRMWVLLRRNGGPWRVAEPQSL